MPINIFTKTATNANQGTSQFKAGFLRRMDTNSFNDDGAGGKYQLFTAIDYELSNLTAPDNYIRFLQQSFFGNFQTFTAKFAVEGQPSSATAPFDISIQLFYEFDDSGTIDCSPLSEYETLSIPSVPNNIDTAIASFTFAQRTTTDGTSAITQVGDPSKVPFNILSIYPQLVTNGYQQKQVMFNGWGGARQGIGTSLTVTPFIYVGITPTGAGNLPVINFAIDTNTN